MERQGDEVHIETDEARGGSSPNIVRWVLGISLFAAIALLSVIWIAGAATSVEQERPGEGRDRALQDYGSAGGVLSSKGDNTDSIVGENADEFEAAEPGDRASALPAVDNDTGATPAPSAN